MGLIMVTLSAVLTSNRIIFYMEFGLYKQLPIFQRLQIHSPYSYTSFILLSSIYPMKISLVPTYSKLQSKS